LLGKITALGGEWRDEPILAPGRARLLSIINGAKEES
jgi:hypothetical protein